MKLAVLSCLVLIACGGSHDKPAADAPPPVDAAADDASPDAAPSTGGADIATTLQCGPTQPAGPGGGEFQLATVDTTRFPDALCNDGTPAVLYFRPYNGASNRNKWVLNLHGGGSCASGVSCAARWCNCENTTVCPFTTAPTNFTRNTMTDVSPPMTAATGVFARGGSGAATNPIGDFNQIEMIYCSSDAWQGTSRAVALTAPNPKTGVPVTFKLHFLGAKILDANLAWLRQDGVGGLTYTLGGGSTALPDLDDATDVIVTGDSAGGAGVIANLDYLRSLLASHNTSAANLHVYGLLDAIVGIDRAPLDYGTYVIPQVRSYDDYLTLRAMSAFSAGARRDESCLALHAADPRICNDTDHVVRNHVTTPFFVRMALRDSNIGGGFVDEMLRLPDMTPLTINLFGLRLHDELTAFAQLSATAEEGAQLTKEPGVFAPACTKHDTIHDNLDTFGTTITPANGTAQRLLGVFENWRTGGGTPTNILTESTTLADTSCP